MNKTMVQIDFLEALERTRKGEAVYALDLKGDKPTLKLFKNLTIDSVTKNEESFIFQIMQEVK